MRYIAEYRARRILEETRRLQGAIDALDDVIYHCAHISYLCATSHYPKFSNRMRTRAWRAVQDVIGTTVVSSSYLSYKGELDSRIFAIREYSTRLFDQCLECKAMEAKCFSLEILSSLQEELQRLSG